MDDTSRSGNKSRLRKALLVLAGLLLFAYAFQVVDIDLKEPLKPKRQENLIGLIRSLARPDLFAYDTETRSTDMSLLMPCPEEPKGSQVTFQGRKLVMQPACATTTQDPIQLSGEEFPPHMETVIYWHPLGSDSPRRIADVKADETGAFAVTFTMPDVREEAEPHRIEVIEILSRRITGPSDATLLGLEKIVETVLMSLIASTVGTMLAIPISFIAAKNLMRDVKLPLVSVMMAVVLAPIGGGIGFWLAQLLVDGVISIDNGLLELVGFIIIVGVVAVLLQRYVLNPSHGRGSARRTGWQGKLQSTLTMLLISALLGLGLILASTLGLKAGDWMLGRLGAFEFIGNFLVVLGNLTLMLLPGIVGLIGVVLSMSQGVRLGQESILQLPAVAARPLTAILSAAGFAVLIYGLGMAVLLSNLLGVRQLAPETTGAQLSLLFWPALVVGLLGAAAAWMTDPKRHYRVGLILYNATRTVLNVLRSIEPLMMGFVFIVWVGLGPFAGILALTLHSVADLGKLFSEQVENINEGPREAITATGANGLQGIAYAVVPQIVPHYIAYIFYRWDINVRMSIIIGFVGGGGIGFVLQRFLNQLQYTRAAVMVIAIALVVMILDYFSSRIRSRII